VLVDEQESAFDEIQMNGSWGTIPVALVVTEAVLKILPYSLILLTLVDASLEVDKVQTFVADDAEEEQQVKELSDVLLEGLKDVALTELQCVVTASNENQPNKPVLKSNKVTQLLKIPKIHDKI
jgi:hypothetical protein